MSGFALRAATAGDFELVLSIRSEAFGPSVRATWADWDDGVERARFVARFARDVANHEIIVVNGRDVGVLELERPDAQGVERLRTLALVSESRGRGIGTAIVRSLLAAHPSLHLRVLKQNQRALAFYRRLGFEIVGTSDDHWWAMKSGGATGI